TLLSPLQELKVECFPETESQTLEQFSSMPGYYLIDAPQEPGWQELIRQNAVKKIFARIFIQELSELGIPTEKWPDVHSFEAFERCFKVEHLALIADLGVEPLITKESALTGSG
ncbi:MAG: hypothetical protein AAFN08_18570, partial [Cyanobacteria bacterium J06559_3]